MHQANFESNERSKMSNASYLFQPDTYVFTGDDLLAEYAKNNLNEDDVTREHALEELRRFIRNHPNILKCRLDSNFLMRFLRANKFNMADSQDAVIRYLKIRQDLPHYLMNLDVQDPGISDLAEKGSCLPIGLDYEGRLVIYATSRHIDPALHNASQIIRQRMVNAESILEIEQCQIRGFVLILDQYGVSMKTLTAISLTELKKVASIIASEVPLMVEYVHVVKLSPVMRLVADVLRPFFPQRIRDKVLFHRSTEDILRYMPKSILPTELGGDNNLQEMNKKWMVELKASRSRLLALDEMKYRVDDSNLRKNRFGSLSNLFMGSRTSLVSKDRHRRSNSEDFD